MSDFQKALMITAIPIVVLSVASTVGASIVGGYEGALGFLFLWLIPASLLLIAIVAAIIYTSTGRRNRAAGIWAGVGIGILSLGLSCFSLSEIIG